MIMMIIVRLLSHHLATINKDSRNIFNEPHRKWIILLIHLKWFIFLTSRNTLAILLKGQWELCNVMLLQSLFASCQNKYCWKKKLGPHWRRVLDRLCRDKIQLQYIPFMILLMTILWQYYNSNYSGLCQDRIRDIPGNANIGALSQPT